MLDAFRELLTLERTKRLGVVSPQMLNSVVGLVKSQLAKAEKRQEKRAAAGDEDDEGDDEEKEADLELLSTACNAIGEMLRLHGAAALPTVESQLMPHVQKWFSSEEPAFKALALTVFNHVIEHAGREHNKKYVAAVLPVLAATTMLSDAAPSAEDASLRQAAVAGLGIVAEHGGKLLSRNAATEAGRQMLALLQQPEAKFSSNVEASEAAAITLGKLLVHRTASLDASIALPEFLAWVPPPSTRTPLEHRHSDPCGGAVARSRCDPGLDPG